MGGSLDREMLVAAREIVRRLRRRRRVWVVLEPDGRIIVLAALLLLLAGCGSVSGQAAAPARAAATARPTVSLESQWARRFEVLEWHVVTEYGYVSVVGELRNNNAVPVGVQLLITAYDKDGAVVDSSQCWPASLENVPANSTFPIDCPLTGRPGVERVTLRIEGARQWD